MGLLALYASCKLENKGGCFFLNYIKDQTAKNLVSKLPGFPLP